MKTAESGIASLSFVCISRAEKNNKDQTPQVVILAEKNNVSWSCFFFLLGFSSEFFRRSLERYHYVYNLALKGVGLV